MMDGINTQTDMLMEFNFLDRFISFRWPRGRMKFEDASGGMVRPPIADPVR